MNWLELQNTANQSKTASIYHQSCLFHHHPKERATDMIVQSHWIGRQKLSQHLRVQPLMADLVSKGLWKKAQLEAQIAVVKGKH